MNDNYCPQVTLVFTRSEQLNTNFNPDTSLVGVRIPDHAFLRQVCRYSTVQYSTYSTVYYLCCVQVVWRPPGPDLGQPEQRDQQPPGGGVQQPTLQVQYNTA